ncbi:hypothetical protein Sango_1755300 [Sesamum angolense]|uniref:Uncharacterized protein n=1 Tax=Sesamum angolense TaxID=2727404 RepID=A0AAE1WGE9_9LAMI|nr:hypothetical protein Sango_1755300 [Sesamum angolense]
MNSKRTPWRRFRVRLPFILSLIAVFTVLGVLMVDLRSIDPSSELPINNTTLQIFENDDILANMTVDKLEGAGAGKKCATVEEMGEIFSRGYLEESLRVRRIIHNHFAINGASRVRELHPEEFCNHGFVIGKASEAGLGNELYKILTAAALSVMLNRSLIIAQTRGRYPFDEFISYSNISFTMKEVKHLWRQNRCLTKYGRHLVPKTTDAVAAQFFLKNIHPEMREAASDLFGRPENLQYRANVFGELMRILISPSRNVEWAVNWALSGGKDPDIALHMRMMMNRSVRAKQAALDCVRRAVNNLPVISRPKVVLVSDTPSMVKEITPSLQEFAEVVHFDYSHFEGNISSSRTKSNNLNFRVQDWGPAPRWVAFVDFFLASRAKHAVISGAHRRVGTTYAQLIAALAAAYRLEENASSNSSITFLSSFHLLSEGLKDQGGWGHLWNRFAGPLSCHSQPKQCALAPILPPAWWDGLWQSPIPRDIEKMEAYGIKLSGFGTFDESQLNHLCRSRKKPVVTVQLI